MITNRIILPWRFLALLALSVHLAHSEPTQVITINAAKKQGAVNPLVFGHNIVAADSAYIFNSDFTNMDLVQTGEGFWDPATTLPNPMIAEKSEEVGMTVLRYPGGCYVHNFDWRQTVGPEAKARGWKFGLDEYLSLCNTLKAVAMITVSDYVLPRDQMPQNAAALVEYLNSPADSAHPWAEKRKAWGHANPYGVTWFELGNESDHGNHRVLPHRQYTAEEYAAYANSTASAMRKVDPAIKVGLVMEAGSGVDVESNWNRTVVHLAGRSADFLVIHLYTPAHVPWDASETLMMESTMAVADQSEHYLLEYSRMAKRESGRDLPLAVTEYNAQLGETVKSYRFSFGVALECADLIRVFLKPEIRVLAANYWQFLNGYFGMLWFNRKLNTLTAEPAFSLYHLWAAHFGSELVESSVRGKTADFPGLGDVAPSNGNTFEPAKMQAAVPFSRIFPKRVGSFPGGFFRCTSGGGFEITVQSASGNSFPSIARFPTPSAPSGELELLTLRFEARYLPDPGSDSTAQVGLGLLDSRGWNKTHSGIGLDGITTGWTPFEGTYRAPREATAIDLTARFQMGSQAQSGRLEVRNFSIVPSSSGHFPAYPLLTSASSLSADESKLFVIVFNKSDREDILTDVHLLGFSAANARYWEVNGPSLASFDQVRETVTGARLQADSPGNWSHVFPAHSMTAIEFSLK